MRIVIAPKKNITANADKAIKMIAIPGATSGLDTYLEAKSN
jgi:hypothetical protein